MRERLVQPNIAVEGSHQRARVMPVRDLRDVGEIVHRTGGTLLFGKDTRTTLTIIYENGEIKWRGPFLEATPFLDIKVGFLGKGPHGEWIGTDAAILRKNSIVLISPNFSNDEVISGYQLSKGKIREFEIPANEANKNYLKAGKMANQLAPSIWMVRDALRTGGRIYPTSGIAIL